jgi:hypothetical protein
MGTKILDSSTNPTEHDKVAEDREDFSDAESQRVLKLAAFAMIDVIARQAADDYINELYTPKDPDEASSPVRPVLLR